MNARERVMAALRHEETDFVPYQVNFTSQAYEAMAAALGDADFESKLGNHLAFVGYDDGNKRPIAQRPGYAIDDFGVVWNRTGADRDIGVVEESLLQRPTLEGFDFPGVDEAWFKAAFNLDRLPADCFRFCGVGFSMFERAWSLRGMQNVLMDMLLEESFVHELMERLCERNLKIVDLALAAGVDGICFGDDWGRQSGMIMGPERWRALIKPYMARLYERVKAAGKVVAQHSCGAIQEIFPDLIDIGLDVYQTVMPEIYDLESIKRRYGRNLCFWGAISAQGLLPRGTPGEVRESVARTLCVMGAGGGYIAGPTHTVTHDVPVENVLAMMDALRNQQG